MQRGNDVPSQRTPVNMALKMLISPKEGACILGPNGSFSKQIIDMTGARLQLSQKGDFYPGTQMQELCVKGATNDSVVQAMMQVISRMSEDAGRIFGGETEVEEGGARVHFVVPVESAKAVIGKGGESIKSIRAESGMRIHVEEIVVGAGEMAEQVVSCAGPVKSLVAIVGFLIEKVMEVSSLPWFRDWASDLKACPGGIPTTQVVKGGKGAPMIGLGGGKMSAKGSGYASAPVTPAAGIEQLKGALSALPDHLADPMDQSQVVQCVCPAHLVASLGHRLQQIAGATGTHVDVRNVPGNPDRAITITGNAVACSAAYLHVVSQLSGGNMGGTEQPIQQMQPMQQMQMQPMQSVGHANAGMGGMGCMGGMCGMGGGGSMGNMGNMGGMGNMGNMGNMGAVGASNFL